MAVLENMMLAIIFLLMLGMGATVDAEQIKALAKGPQRFALVIGFCCQYGIMPLTAWILGQVLGLDKEHALALLLVGSMPGGTTSNFFCYLAGGDVALSLGMTVVSSLAGVGMVPLVLRIYAPSIAGTDGSSAEIRVPYVEVLLSMLFVLIPASIGAGVRAKSVKGAKMLEQAGTLAGVFFIAGAYVVGLLGNATIFLAEPARVWAAAALLQPTGMLLGFLVGKLLRLHPKSTVAVSLETGVQNSTLAVTILAISYPSTPLLNKLLVVPLMYSMFLIVEALVGVLVIRLLKCSEVPESSACLEKGEQNQKVEEEQTADHTPLANGTTVWSQASMPAVEPGLVPSETREDQPPSVAEV